ncbi:MAG: hypothetical protein HYY25_09805 [Candidatus Wallbacteria bacterium]|nr:hypothetical protein [Candidatus Wallbacteria bacterium]
MKPSDAETPGRTPEEAARVKVDEILGITFFTIGMLLLVGWRFEQSGAFHSVATWLLASIGAGMWYLILMFALWGINKFRGRAILSDWVQFAAWVVMLPVFLGFLQSFRPVDRDLGGTIGWTLYTNLENLTGTFSARVLLAGFFLILTVVCLDTPLTQIVASGYRAGGRATGVVGPVVMFPFVVLYTAVFHLLTFIHMLVFILLKDLVVLFDILYDRIMTTDEALPSASGAGALAAQSGMPQQLTPSKLPPPIATAAPPRVDPIVELNRPEVPAAKAEPAQEHLSEPESLPEPEPLQGAEPPELAAPPILEEPRELEEDDEYLPPPGTMPDDSTQGLFLIGSAARRAEPVSDPGRPAEHGPAAPAAQGGAPSAKTSAQPPAIRSVPAERVFTDQPAVERLDELSVEAEADPELAEEPEEDFEETEEERRQAEAMHNILRPAQERPVGPEAPSEPALAKDLEVKTFPAHETAPAQQQSLLGAMARTVGVAARDVVKAAARLAEYRKPSEDLFLDPPALTDREDETTLRSNAEKLVEALGQFRIQASVTRITQGPTITQYEVKPAPGVKISNIINLSNDIAMALATAAIRIEAPIPGRSAVGIEIPNRKPTPVTFKEIITHDTFRKHESLLSFAIGKDITGRPVVADLTRMPHLLVAGATGSGKSVCINTIISSILYKARPDEVKFILIDPKVVELTLYDGIPNLITEVITDPQDATAALRWAVLEMERRYRYLSKFAARDIRSFNRRLAAGDLQPLDGHTQVPDGPMPYIVVVIDELADLMMLARKEIEDAITRLAQMARAIGIHLVLATQRPSTNIITGVLKANLPSRIAFSVSSQVDSKVILDGAGAEKLLGSGDMLYSPIGQAKPIRLQGAFISEEEVRNLVAHLKTCGDPDYTNIVEEVMEPETDTAGEGLSDDKFADCVRIALEQQEASTSMLQRHLKIGYNRAARIIEAMEARGIISGPESGKRRKLLISAAEAERFFAAAR